MRRIAIGGWFLAAIVLCIPGAVRSADDVVVTVGQQVFAPGDRVTIAVENNTGAVIFLPGCHPFEVEEFRNDAYTRVRREPCSWEGTATAIEPGRHEFDYATSPDDDNGIFRISVTYGWGCKGGIALGQARCEDFSSSLSASYRVGGG
jgi:hypothetical protein